MQDDLFGPLGMTGCGFGAPGTAALVDQPWGHLLAPVSPQDPHSDNPPGMGPAGTVNCDLASWGKFLALHASSAPRLVKPATLAHLHTPPKGGNYMGGWLTIGALLAHEGTNTMWHAIAIVKPSSESAVALVANKDDAELFFPIFGVVGPYLR
jgi:CubicO group peptidase (beta-lactamase class C family)